MHSINALLTGKGDREVMAQASCDSLEEVQHILMVRWLIKSSYPYSSKYSS